MKQLITLALALVLALSLAACDMRNAAQDAAQDAVEDAAEDAAENVTEEPEPESEPEPEPEEEAGGEIVAEADAVGTTVENQALVARYIGDSAMFGAARQYVVMEYFNEDGTIDEMWGTSKMLFFFDDEASYDAGFAEASEGGAGYVKEENRASLYFSTSGGISNGGDWSSFSELAELIDTKSQRNPEYSQYEIIWR